MDLIEKHREYVKKNGNVSNALMAALSKIDGLELAANPENKRPVCSCGCAMNKIQYKGYYDTFEYWECPSFECNVLEQFEVGKVSKGSWA
jgi:hypothetical protein